MALVRPLGLFLRLRTLLPVFFFVVATAIAPRAHAQDTNDPAALLQRGVELRRRGKDAEALDAFVRADALAPSPRAKAQRALAEQALGRWVAAEQHLVEASSSTDDAWVKKNRPVLEASLAEIRTHLGTLEISTTTPGAILFVDGDPRGPAPSTRVRVAAGTMVVEVRAPGFTTTRRTVQVAPGATVRESFTLVAEPSTATPSVVPAPLAAPAPTAPTAAVEQVPLATTPPRAPRWPAYVALGVGAAGAVVGTYFGVRTFTLKGQRDDACAPCSPASINAATSLHSQAVTAATISTIAIATAVVSVGVGTWLLMAPRREVPAAPSVALSPTLSGLRLDGTF